MHEAEGDHVLSKKKLDELVRQVCGAAVEGQEPNMLTPEVEEVGHSYPPSLFLLPSLGFVASLLACSVFVLRLP